jgi:peptidyl-prolyl cis-trans isomerase D
VRRIQVGQANPQAVPVLRTLFSMSVGKARMVRDTEGRGFFVVKVNKVTPANALTALPLVGRMRADLQQSAADDYVRQFLSAVQEDMKIRRNEKEIQALKQRLASSGG